MKQLIKRPVAQSARRTYENLAELRKANGIPQAKLGWNLYIMEIERGDRMPGMALLRRMTDRINDLLESDFTPDDVYRLCEAHRKTRTKDRGNVK